MKALWERIDPKYRRYAVVGMSVAALLALILMFSPDKKARLGERDRENVVEHVLTDMDVRETSLEAVVERLERLRTRNAELEREIERLRTDLDRKGQSGRERRMQAEIASLRKEIRALTQELDRLRREQRKLSGRQEDAAAEPEGRPPASAPPPAASGGAPDAGSAAAEDVVPDPNRLFREAPLPKPEDSIAPSASASARKKAEKQAPEIVSVVEEAPGTEKEPGQKETLGLYLPAGSIISGVTLTGMDAPTGQAARRDPFPLLLRIKHDALLPNRFRQDIRECFMTAAGYGDLSSERAYLRAETISCVREDGGVIEQRIQAFATGEDGKAGIRGRLVSKQGQLIARSMIAGFMEGLSRMFSYQPIPVLATSPSDTQPFQKMLSPEALQSGALQGAGRALDRIARFYIDMASDMYPVIEIDAGRKIDFIVQKGVALNAR